MLLLPFGYVFFFLSQSEGRTILYFVFELFFFRFRFRFVQYDLLLYHYVILLSLSFSFTLLLVQIGWIACSFLASWLSCLASLSLLLCLWLHKKWCAFHRHYASFTPSMYIINFVAPFNCYTNSTVFFFHLIRKLLFNWIACCCCSYCVLHSFKFLVSFVSLFSSSVFVVFLGFYRIIKFVIAKCWVE